MSESDIRMFKNNSTTYVVFAALKENVKKKQPRHFLLFFLHVLSIKY